MKQRSFHILLMFAVMLFAVISLGGCGGGSSSNSTTSSEDNVMRNLFVYVVPRMGDIITSADVQEAK